MKAAPLSVEALSAVVGALPDDSLTASRRAALEQLRSTGLPGVREEDWKYTDLALAVGIANDWLESGAATHAAAEIPAIVESIDADWIVITNGQLSSDPLSIDGVEITRLSDSDDDVSPVGRLGELNVALLRDGLRIAIDSDVELARPIGLLVNDDSSNGPGVSQVRVDITSAPNSRARIIEYHASVGDAGHYSNSVVRLAVGDGAQVDYLRIQDRDRKHAQTGHTSVRSAATPAFATAPLTSVGNWCATMWQSTSNSPGAAANLPVSTWSDMASISTITRASTIASAPPSRTRNIAAS